MNLKQIKQDAFNDELKKIAKDLYKTTKVSPEVHNDSWMRLVADSDKRNSDAHRRGVAPKSWTKEEIARYPGVEYLFKKKASLSGRLIHDVENMSMAQLKALNSLAKERKVAGAVLPYSKKVTGSSSASERLNETAHEGEHFYG